MKTNLTNILEKNLYHTTHKVGVFGCFEVTIGYNGNERVDFLTMDTKEIFRCYEIKVSKADFYSKCKKSFVGNYNYYVLTKELYEIVKDDIPDYVGVYINPELGLLMECVKNAKRRDLLVDKDILKNCLIRSLTRDTCKFYENNFENIKYKRVIHE